MWNLNTENYLRAIDWDTMKVLPQLLPQNVQERVVFWRHRRNLRSVRLVPGFPHFDLVCVVDDDHLHGDRLPGGLFIGRSPENIRNILLTLVMIPFWTSFLIRTYAWITILSKEGLVNSFLVSAQIIPEPMTILYTPFASVLGLRLQLPAIHDLAHLHQRGTPR